MFLIEELDIRYQGDQALFWPVYSTEVCPATKVALHWPDNSSIEVGYSIQEV